MSSGFCKNVSCLQEGHHQAGAEQASTPQPSPWQGSLVVGIYLPVLMIRHNKRPVSKFYKQTFPLYLNNSRSPVLSLSPQRF